MISLKVSFFMVCFYFFESQNFLPKSLRLGFLTRIGVSASLGFYHLPPLTWCIVGISSTDSNLDLLFYTAQNQTSWYCTDTLIGNKITLDRIFLKLAYSADKNTVYKMLNMCFYRYTVSGLNNHYILSRFLMVSFVVNYDLHLQMVLECLDRTWLFRFIQVKFTGRKNGFAQN